MTDRTPLTWQARCDRLAILVPTISLVTGYSQRSIRAYRQGQRKPPQDFLEKVDELLVCVELAVSGGTAA